MFEKEAKEYGDNYVKSKYMETVDETWQKGAEFGYNKGRNEAKEQLGNLLEVIKRPYQFTAPRKIQMVKQAEQFLKETE